MPLEMLLGFFVTLVVTRWWEQCVKLPNPDKVATMLKAGINVDQADDEVGMNQRIRRTVVRHVMLSYVLNLRRTSPSLRGDFPDMASLVKNGLLREDEVSFWFTLNFDFNVVLREPSLVKRISDKLISLGSPTGTCPSSGATATLRRHWRMAGSATRTGTPTCSTPSTPFAKACRMYLPTVL